MNDEDFDGWFDDIAEANDSGNLRPLIERLLSNEAMPRKARVWLADLLARHQLKRRKGGQANPVWDPSDAEVSLRKAEREYERLLREGVSKTDAIKQAAELYGLKPSTLQLHIDGRLGASNRKPL
jgi:hypothetical protein